MRIPNLTARNHNHRNGYGTSLEAVGADALSIVHIGTYPPRQCGIATFTEDLARAIDQHAGVRESTVVALERADEPSVYPRRVSRTIRDHDPAEYRHAARALNRSGADLVLLQFEFGIFGGADGEHVLGLLDELTLPVVTILHTVLPDPQPHQRELLRAVAQRSRRFVVMNSLAVDLLERVYAIPRAQIVVIPHGAPELPREEHQRAATELGVAGQRVLSTFGLLSRGKGLQFAIEAMATIAGEFPEAVYYILGRTHPGVVRAEGGDHYRAELQSMVRALRLERNVRFVDEYLDQPQLLRWLSASEVYLTPYLEAGQIVSGTLAYALVAGKAIVSTPYLHAQELLHDRRGMLVRFRDASAIADAVGQLLRDEPLRCMLGQRAWRHGRSMTWRAVAQRYGQLFRQVAARTSVWSASAFTSPQSPRLAAGHVAETR